MAKGSGNGGRGGDLIVSLHAEVVELRTTLARHHRETDHHLLRIGRMLSHVGDRLNDHEQRLAAIEEKVG